VQAVTGPVEAVIFDWGGTLTPWHTVDVRDAWLAYACSYDPQAPVDRTAELADRLHRAEDAAWVAGRDHHTSTTIGQVFAAAGIQACGQLHAAGMDAYVSAWEPHTWTDPEAAPTLRALRGRGIRVGLLSNTLWSREHHERILARDGVLQMFDGSVLSSEIGWTKPHPEAFRAAMAAVSVSDPARVVFVGDRPFDDIRGARSVGMRTVLVPHSDIPQVQRGHTEAVPDAVVHRLSELVDVVDRWMG
jgi:putative hydrolase of the HAD superfamily